MSHSKNKSKSSNTQPSAGVNAGKNRNQSKAAAKPFEFRNVLWIWLASFVLHTILNILVKEAPTVVIDEGLYTNIARSLAWKGELAFRGQPVNYPYLLYPMLLVPLYWLNHLLGGDIFRYIQVFNTLLITSSVLPAALFARDFTKDRKQAYLAAGIVAILPDMVMGGYSMSESLIWPLALWMIFFAYRFYTNHELKDGLLTGLFTGLMFAVKPGAIAVGAGLLLFCVISAIRKDRKQLRNSLFSVGLVLVIVGIVYGIFLLLFRQGDSLLGLYTKQTSEWNEKTLLVILEAFPLLAFLFVFACGGVFGWLPLVRFRQYPKEDRPFVVGLLIGVLAVILGTAVFVVPYKWDGGIGELPLHLRYCSMYIPVFFVISQKLFPEKTQKAGLGFTIVLLAFIALSLFPGARSGFVYKKTGSIDLVTLNAFYPNMSRLDGNTTGWILTILVVLASFWMLIHARSEGINRALQKGCTVFFAAFLLFNTVCAHIAASPWIDPTISEDAMEVNSLVGDTECLGVTQRYYDDIKSYWLDGRLNYPMQQVTSDQMFIQMEETDGVYTPFVPVEQAPNVNNHETPDTDTIVLGCTIAEHLELSDSVTAQKTKSGHFTVVQVTPSERWVDTMMYGLDGDALYPGVTGYIHVFDDARNVDGMITLSITASGPGALQVAGQRIQLTDKEETYEITCPFQNLIVFQAEDQTIQITSYTTSRSDR